jgi:hypothetical protein
VTFQLATSRQQQNTAMTYQRLQLLLNAKSPDQANSSTTICQAVKSVHQTYITCNILNNQNENLFTVQEANSTA